MKILYYCKHLLVLSLLLIGCINSGYASDSRAPATFPSADDEEAVRGTIRSATAISLITTASNEPIAHNSDPLSASVIAGGRRVGLDTPHIVEIRQALAEEHAREVNDMICTRWCFRKCANWNEAIGNTAGYLAMATPPLAGAVMLIPATAVASPYIVLVGTVAVGVKVFCMGLASCSAREAAERHQTLDQLASAIGAHPVNTTPTITGPDSNTTEPAS